MKTVDVKIKNTVLKDTDFWSCERFCIGFKVSPGHRWSTSQLDLSSKLWKHIVCPCMIQCERFQDSLDDGLEKNL